MPAVVIHAEGLSKRYHRGLQVAVELFLFNRMESSVADRV